MTRFSFPDAPGDLLGAHISTQGGLHTVFERASAIKATALAMFAKNSNQWKGKTLTDEAIAEFTAARNVLPIVTHASYLINLATTNPEFHAKSIAGMIDELDRAGMQHHGVDAETLGAIELVDHAGDRLRVELRIRSPA